MSGHSVAVFVESKHAALQTMQKWNMSSTDQYSTPFSLPQPITDTMWLMVGYSFLCMKMPPATHRSSSISHHKVSVALLPIHRQVDRGTRPDHSRVCVHMTSNAVQADSPS
jgi:hypothetical protein